MSFATADDGSPRRQRAGRDAPGAPVYARSGEAPRALLARAGLAGEVPRPVIVVSGGAGDLEGSQLAVARAMLGPGVAAAASRTGAAVVDGGTDSGVMGLIGDERARNPAAIDVLLGVAPAGRVDSPAAGDESQPPLEPNHTHLVLADSDEWGGETPLLASLADALAHGAHVVMVVAGGGDGARQEVGEAIRRGWPLFVLEGTGGLADEIAARREGRGGNPQLRSELARGRVRAIGGTDPSDLAGPLAWELQDEPALKDAWVMFATYDRLAVRLRDTFERFQLAILVLGIVATTIALVHDAARADPLRNVLHWLAVAAPIFVSVLIALANQRASGKRWVLLRAAAEAVKSEIYRYRTATGVYARSVLDSGSTHVDAPQKLAERLAAIEGGLIQTDASGGPLTPYDGLLPPRMYGAEHGDDGLSALDPARYVEMRIADQIGYYAGRVHDLGRRRAVLQLVTLASGGVGALLAAAGAEIWIGATTALAGAALAHLGYLQADSSIVSCNQAAAQLAALQREFRAGGGATPAFETLVTRGESVLLTEVGGWVQQMTEALAQQQADQTKAVERAARARTQ